MKSKKQVLDFLLEDRIKFATVSGIFTTKPSLIDWVDNFIPSIELITTKSYTVKPRTGNREPIIAELGIGNYANAVGLKNPGMEQGYQDLSKLNLRSYLNISLSGNTIDDFIALIKRFEDIADILELNFSCPNVPVGGSAIGSSEDLVKEYMRELRKVTNVLLFPKLTPNVDNIGEIALAAIEHGANGLSGINTYNPEEYFEPHTKKTILYNPNNHIGGKSGEDIKEIAIEKISEMRKAVPSYYPIIGMGGITTGEDVRNMRNAGANVIGIGSAFARVPMQLRPEYVLALKDDVENETNHASDFLSQKRLAEYFPYRINKIVEIEEDLRIFELEGNIYYEPSQFAFLWVPEVGEKPFSIAKSNPLTFLIKKQKHNPKKNQGLVTHALFQLKQGDGLMIRSVYGDAPHYSEKNNAYIIAGGTGIAVVPRLIEELDNQGKNITVYHGITNKNQIVFEDEIEKYANFIPIPDNGIPSRVVNVMQQNLSTEEISNSCFYNIGPVPLMEKAMNIEEKLGINPQDIFSSIETNNMCGIGLCGECVCGDKLTCQEGTFFSLEYLKSNNIDISNY